MKEKIHVYGQWTPGQCILYMHKNSLRKNDFSLSVVG